MRKKATSIPVNPMAEDFGTGIAIDRLAVQALNTLEKADFERSKLAHREASHTFFLLEKGSVFIEIDFQKYTIESPSVIYMHPDQVHRVLEFENIVVASWSLTSENLHPEYLKILEEITPVKPLLLEKETLGIITEALALCIRFSERKKDKLYHLLLKDSCNALTALVIAQYLEKGASTDKLPRFEIVTKAFRQLLERNYTSIKSPAVYARQLNISTAYLNECIKNTTGYSVSHHIRQRVILEAKRLLYHSDQSVKEIATVLGYDDYPYFSRLFTKVAGMTALSFRSKNHD